MKAGRLNENCFWSIINHRILVKLEGFFFLKKDSYTSSLDFVDQNVVQVRSNKCKFLQWVSGNFLKDKTRNESIHKKLEVASIMDKVKKRRRDGLGTCSEN